MRQVLRAGALGKPRGMGWGRRWERGSGWGTHVNPWLIHVNVWQNPLEYCKVINLQLIKINGKKRKENGGDTLYSVTLYLYFIHFYRVGVTNKFKGLDLVDRVSEELWMEVCNIV